MIHLATTLNVYIILLLEVFAITHLSTAMKACVESLFVTYYAVIYIILCVCAVRHEIIWQTLIDNTDIV